jgi:hypothetical protein
VIIPVGGLNPRGSLQVVSDPVPALYRLDKVLNMPIRLELPDHTRLYETPGWGESPTVSTLVSDFVLHTNDSRPAIRITAARNADARWPGSTRSIPTDCRRHRHHWSNVAAALWFLRYSVSAAARIE